MAGVFDPRHKWRAGMAAAHAARTGMRRLGQFRGFKADMAAQASSGQDKVGGQPSAPICADSFR